MTSSAAAWELRPLSRGTWPAEKRIPLVSGHAELRAYDADCLASQVSRRAGGRPFRDFESTVFVVPKKDGKFRLCTDYRALNEFQRKVPFKMDTLQSVADCIQQNDFGMLVDLTDCYLTMGLHPSQRKYCRFHHPQMGRRMQWKTVSFGMSEAPRICTKLLRPLMGLLKRLGRYPVRALHRRPADIAPGSYDASPRCGRCHALTPKSSRFELENP